MLPLIAIRMAPWPDEENLATEEGYEIIFRLTPGYVNRTLEHVLATIRVLLFPPFQQRLKEM